MSEIYVLHAASGPDYWIVAAFDDESAADAACIKATEQAKKVRGKSVYHYEKNSKIRGAGWYDEWHAQKVKWRDELCTIDRVGSMHCITGGRVTYKVKKTELSRVSHD